jgi:transcription antitermination factor NusG
MSGSSVILKSSVSAEPERLLSSPQSPTCWFAVETKARFEKKVTAQLENKGFKVFLPLLTENHIWTDRNKSVTVPLFPGYAFVLTDRSQSAYHGVLRTAGLIRFVSFGGVVAEVAQKHIDDLELLLRQKVPLSLHAFVDVGRRVKIKSGSLKGLEGILMKCEKEKLVVSIHSIQRSLAIEIQGYDLEPV